MGGPTRLDSIMKRTHPVQSPTSRTQPATSRNAAKSPARRTVLFDHSPDFVLHRLAVNLRASRKQKALIDQAAEALGRSRSDFMLDTVCREAEAILLHRRYFVSEDAFRRFNALLDKPPKRQPETATAAGNKTASAIAWPVGISLPTGSHVTKRVLLELRKRAKLDRPVAAHSNASIRVHPFEPPLTWLNQPGTLLSSYS